MKRVDLVKYIINLGYCLHRTTGKHDIYVRHEKSINLDRYISIPRHKIINKFTAEKLIKVANGLKLY